MPRIKRITCFALFGALTASSALAQDYAMMDDDWRIYVGVFQASVDSKIQINGDDLPPGPPIDIEDVLGVDDSEVVAWGGASWHFARRHSVEAEFFVLNRNASVTETFDPPLQIGDTIIESGTVGTSYDTSVYRVTYGFSAIRSERTDLQLKAGLHIASLKTDIGLEGAICGPDTTPSSPPGCPPLGTSTENEDVSAPLPHLGASWAYALTPTIAVNVAAIGFAVEIEDIEGSILELDADIAWQPFDHVGFGLGYRFFRVDVDSTGSELNGKFEFEYNGPTLFVQATF
jgi:hypothetical protein